LGKNALFGNKLSESTSRRSKSRNDAIEFSSLHAGWAGDEGLDEVVFDHSIPSDMNKCILGDF
jgi:hypothetical protein